MTLRGVCEECHSVPAVISIDRGRKARRLAGKPGEYETPAARAHHFGEVRAGITRGPVALADHVYAVRLEPFGPAREPRYPVEQRRTVDPARERERNAHLACVRQRGAAVGQRALGLL